MNKLIPPLAQTPFFSHEYEQYLVAQGNYTPPKVKPSRNFDYLPYIDVIANEITLIKSAEVADVRRGRLNSYANRLNTQTLASYVNNPKDYK